MIFRQANRDELADIAASLVLIEGEARVARTQAGIVVSEQGPDGAWRQVAPEWHGASPPPWANDTADELRDRIEMMLDIVPDAVRDMVPAVVKGVEDELEKIRAMPPAGGQHLDIGAPQKRKARTKT